MLPTNNNSQTQKSTHGTIGLCNCDDVGLNNIDSGVLRKVITMEFSRIISSHMRYSADEFQQTDLGLDSLLIHKYHRMLSNETLE